MSKICLHIYASVGVWVIPFGGQSYFMLTPRINKHVIHLQITSALDRTRKGSLDEKPLKQ